MEGERRMDGWREREIWWKREEDMEAYRRKERRVVRETDGEMREGEKQ